MQVTKTFVEHRWYKRDDAGNYTEFSPTGVPTLSIDQQVADWVTDTSATIVHPGQLGMHTAWHGTVQDPYQTKCIIFGLTVLYQA